MKRWLLLALCWPLLIGQGSRNFDGVNDRVDASSAVLDPKGQAKTILVWLDPDVVNSNDYYWSVNDSAGTRSAIALISGGFASGSIQFQLSDSTQDSTKFLIRRTSGGEVGTTGWYRVAITHTGTFTDATTVKIYINNVEATYGVSQNGSATEATHSGSWSIGGRTADDTVNYDGELAYFQYFNRALSTVEIEEAFWHPTIVADGLQWLIPMWGDSPEADLSGGARTGTIVNGTATSQDGPPVFLTKRWRRSVIERLAVAIMPHRPLAQTLLPRRRQEGS